MSGLEPGSTLGSYKILARLRAGAMGVLYLGRRIGPAGFSRPVAIKVIHDHLAQDRRFCRMFIDEAKLSARIDDPNVVRVEEFGEAGGRYYLVMEYVDGTSLAQVLGLLRHKGGIPIDQAVAIAMHICAGLHGAHEATDEDGTPLGIVHRDVSPHNVLVSYKGFVRLIDFGIAKARAQGGGGQTRTGSLRGKLAYMPPEQARSARTVDRRADLYAVGLVLWEMLTGRRLFDAESEVALMNQIRNPVIVPPSAVAHHVPAALDAVVLRALAQEPDGRPSSGAAMQRLLGDAHPAARGVLASDLAELMARVKKTATNLAMGDDEGGGLYAEEVRRHLTVFGKSMDESVKAADEVRPPPSSGVPSAPKVITSIDDDDDATEAMVGGPVVVLEDEPTEKNPGPPSAPPHSRPHRVSTVRLSQPSMPAIDPSRASAPPPPPREVAPPRGRRSVPVRGRDRDRTLVLAFVLPALAAFVGAIVIVVSSGRRVPSASASATASPAATTATASVVELDPAPGDALERARQAAIEGRPAEVRALLEPSVRSGHGSLEAVRLVLAACRMMGDASCREDVRAKYPHFAGPAPP